MKNAYLLAPVIFIFFHCRPMVHSTTPLEVIENYTRFNGVAPSLLTERENVHMVFASGDSIFYCLSVDAGNRFYKPLLVDKLAKLSIGGGRGPQIVSSNGQLIIVAVDQAGNIFTFIKKKKTNSWERGKKINDVPDIAKEGFVSLASNDKVDVYAVWLDLRDDNEQSGGSE